MIQEEQHQSFQDSCPLNLIIAKNKSKFAEHGGLGWGVDCGLKGDRFLEKQDWWKMGNFQDGGLFGKISKDRQKAWLKSSLFYLLRRFKKKSQSNIIAYKTNKCQKEYNSFYFFLKKGKKKEEDWRGQKDLSASWISNNSKKHVSSVSFLGEYL
mgnify:CR=1 FL=1